MGVESKLMDAVVSGCIGFAVGVGVGVFAVRYKGFACSNGKSRQEKYSDEDEDLLEIVHQLAIAYEKTDKYFHN